MTLRAIILGGQGAIGKALSQQLVSQSSYDEVVTVSRQHPIDQAEGVTSYQIESWDEAALADVAQKASQGGAFNLIFVATGFLQNGTLMPEKSLKELSAEAFQFLFHANTIVPALIAKHFLPHLVRDQRGIFAALSARVGSLSDNKLGGWYAYRASKAALNMVIKNTAIELARTHQQAIVVGLHPGTVESPLSKPFQKRVPKNQLFTPSFSAEKLLEVLEKLTPRESGNCYAWDGQEIPP